MGALYDFEFDETYKWFKKNVKKGNEAEKYELKRTKRIVTCTMPYCNRTFEYGFRTILCERCSTTYSKYTDEAIIENN